VSKRKPPKPPRPYLRPAVVGVLLVAGILGGCTVRSVTRLYDCIDQPNAGGMAPDGQLFDAQVCAGGVVILTPNGRRLGRSGSGA